MNEVKKLNLMIFGKNYSICTDENEEDVSQAGEMVNSLLKEFATKASTKDESKFAVLAALQLAIDLTKSRKQLKLWQTEATIIMDSLEDKTKEL